MYITAVSSFSGFGKKSKNNKKAEKPAEEKDIFKNISYKDMYKDVKVSSLPYIPGKEIVECLGPVYGNALWSRSLGKDLAQSWRSIKGGKLTAYSELAKMTQCDAIKDMINNAKELGADGIINYVNKERGMASDSFMRVQGIAVKIKDGNHQKDIAQMKKNGVKISDTQEDSGINCQNVIIWSH